LANQSKLIQHIFFSAIMEVFLTRRERFNAAHRMFRSDWNDAQNYEVYGKCSNPNWHGHNYTLFVTIRGRVNPEIGYVVNLTTLSKVIRETVIDKLDHKNINLEVDFMQGKIASSENLVIAIWNELHNPVKSLGVNLHVIKLEESENNFVEYRGE
jgi:6-pyruvoyltetrahydropterin/6-carboxytetrahydropterin synthase